MSVELVFSGKLAGVSFSPAKENLAQAVKEYGVGGPSDVQLEHDPSNPYDSEAIKVIFQPGGFFVGHIPKPHNSKLLVVGLDGTKVAFERWNKHGEIVVGAMIEVTRSIL